MESKGDEKLYGYYEMIGELFHSENEEMVFESVIDKNIKKAVGKDGKMIFKYDDQNGIPTKILDGKWERIK